MVKADNICIICYDIETTQLGPNAEITQLAAHYRPTEAVFDRFVMPRGIITPVASRLTGITIQNSNGKKQMYHNGAEVVSTYIHTCLLSFLAWIEQLPGGKVLVAHNGKLFDMPIIIRSIVESGLRNDAEVTIAGFADSLPLLKKILPGRTSYKLHQYIPMSLHNRLNVIMRQEIARR